MLEGYTPPLTPEGSSLVPSPPWHYAGTVFSLAYSFDAASGRLPARTWARPPGGPWPTSASGRRPPTARSSRSRLRAVQGVLRRPRGGAGGRSGPLLPVHLRGPGRGDDARLAAGLAKEAGERVAHAELSAGAPCRGATGGGHRLGASLAVKDRRLAQATLTLEGRPGQRLGFLAGGLYGLDAWSGDPARGAACGWRPRATCSVSAMRRGPSWSCSTGRATSSRRSARAASARPPCARWRSR